MYIKNPIKHPTSTKQKIPISSKPTDNEMSAKAINAIADNPPAKPSKPSVKFTALLAPTRINKIASPYNQPNSISIPKVPTTHDVSPPLRIYIEKNPIAINVCINSF